MVEHQNFHLIRILKGKQEEQPYCKEVQSKQHRQASQSNGRLIAALTKNHTRQTETLIKSTTNVMREMMSLIKNNQQAPNNQSNNQQAPNNQSNDEKKKKME